MIGTRKGRWGGVVTISLFQRRDISYVPFWLQFLKKVLNKQALKAGGYICWSNAIDSYVLYIIYDIYAIQYICICYILTWHILTYTDNTYVYAIYWPDRLDQNDRSIDRWMTTMTSRDASACKKKEKKSEIRKFEFHVEFSFGNWMQEK